MSWQLACCAYDETTNNHFKGKNSEESLAPKKGLKLPVGKPMPRALQSSMTLCIMHHDACRSHIIAAIVVEPQVRETHSHRIGKSETSSNKKLFEA
jgi:hypothetical protein